MNLFSFQPEVYMKTLSHLWMRRVFFSLKIKPARGSAHVTLFRNILLLSIENSEQRTFVKIIDSKIKQCEMNYQSQKATEEPHYLELG